MKTKKPRSSSGVFLIWRITHYLQYVVAGILSPLRDNVEFLIFGRQENVVVLFFIIELAVVAIEV